MANPLGLAPGRQAGQFDHVCMHICIYKSIILVCSVYVCMYQSSCNSKS